MTSLPDAPARRRHQPVWSSLRRVVEIQAHNALNDKVAQFILLALAEVLVISQYYPQIVSALLVLPQLFFAPLAGWMADRYSKRRVIIWCSIAQTVLLILIAAAFRAGTFWTATALFFGLAIQAAILSPAKSGIVKELVGERHLTSASGWVQMTTIMAFATGQLIGGKTFEFFHDDVFGHDPWKAAALPLIILTVISLLPVVLAFQIKPTASHCAEKFRWRNFGDHFLHLDDLFKVRQIRLSALGVSFFWLAATMLTLMLIQLAAGIEPNRAARAGLSSEMLGFVAVGVMLGSFFTAWVSSTRIELGLVPLGGVGMAAFCVTAFFTEPGGLVFRLWILGIGACSAMFLIPLNAYLQDQVEPQNRGRMLSAAGLMDSLAMVAGIALQTLMMNAGLPVSWQLVVLGVFCLATSAYVLRIIPQNFIRFMVLSVARIVYRIRVVHPDRVPETGGALLLCNHISYIDALILSAACERPVRFAAFDDLFRNPLLAAGLRMFGVVPISGRRAKNAIVALADALKTGGLVCVFPEGQLTRTGMMNEIRKGFELIARRAGTPVQPVYLDDLWGSVFSFERGRFFRKHPHHFPYHVSVLWGSLIPAAEATAERCRDAFQNLAAEGIMARGEVKRGLAVAVAQALCKEPWRIAAVAGDLSERVTRRGELFGRALQLARRWRTLPAPRAGVLLPEGLRNVTANIALVFAGKTPVNIDPAAARDAGKLRALMQREGLTTLVTTAAFRARFPAFPWPDHLLDVETELEELDEFHVLVDTAFAWLAPQIAVRPWMPVKKVRPGAGYIYMAPEGPAFALISGAELLAQTEMLRGTDLLREGDRLVCGAPTASAAGTVVGLWGTLLRGLACLPLDRTMDAADFSRALLQKDPTCALGDSTFARRCAEVLREFHRPLRSFLLTGAATAPFLPPGALLCPCLVDDAIAAVLAVSMPDPPLATGTSEPQFGHREGSCGRLLPGIRFQENNDGTLTLTLPGNRTCLLPAGSRVDEEGFVFIGPASGQR